MKTRMQPIGMVWNKLPARRARHGRVPRQADPAGDGRRRDGTRPHHHRGHQGSSGSPGPQLVRSRHRTAGGARARGQAAAGKTDSSRLSRRRTGQHRNRRRRGGNRRRAGETESRRERASAARTGREAERSRSAEPDLPARASRRRKTVTNVSGPRRRHGRREVQHREDRRRCRCFQPARRRHHRQAENSSHSGHHSRPGDHQRWRTIRHSPGQSARTDPPRGRFRRKSTSSMCTARRCIAGAAVCCPSLT